MDDRPYWPRMAMAFLALGGLINSSYLTIHRLRPTQSAPLVCGVVGNCEAVQASKYSVFPQPMAFRWPILALWAFCCWWC